MLGEHAKNFLTGLGCVSIALAPLAYVAGLFWLMFNGYWLALIACMVPLVAFGVTELGREIRES